MTFDYHLDQEKRGKATFKGKADTVTNTIRNDLHTQLALPAAKNHPLSHCHLNHQYTWGSAALHQPLLLQNTGDFHQVGEKGVQWVLQ